MKTKYLSFILTLIFLFLLPSSVFSQKKEVRKEFWGEGKLKSEKHYKDEKIDGFLTIWKVLLLEIGRASCRERV